MKIAFYELEGWEESLIRSTVGPEHEILLSNERVLPEHIPADVSCEMMCIFVNSHLTREVIGMFPALKYIVTRSTGYDHIDLNACREQGITVSYVPGYGDNTVAEQAFGLLLTLTRKLYIGIDRIKETGSFSLDGLRGIDLKGKTIGIVGTGRIGKEMIRIANGFQMRVIASDALPNSQLEQELHFTYVAFDELIRTSDIVSLHTPYTKETHHLINKGNIGSMKKSAILINTARGGIVETDALVSALVSGNLAGAGLDVLEEEGDTKDELNLLGVAHPNAEGLRTIIENHVLIRMPNVVVTPHNAFNTNEALERILRITLEDISGFTNGKPVNLVPETK